MINFSKLNKDFFIFFYISFVIIICTGSYAIDFRNLIIFKIILVFFLMIKDNLTENFKEYLYTKKNISVLFFIFFISISLSFIFSTLNKFEFSIRLAGIRYLHTVTDILLFIYLFFYFRKRGVNYFYLFNSIIIPGMIILILILCIFIFSNKIETTNQINFFFSSIRQLGLFLTLITCFYLGHLAYNYNKINQINAIFNLTFFLSLISLMGNRGSFISVICTFLFLIIILNLLKEKVFRVSTIFILSLVLSFIFKELIIAFNDFISKDILSYTHNLNLFRIDNSSFDDRLNQWAYAFELIKKNPLLGLGSNGYAISALYERYTTGYPILSNYSHPHNFILQFLVEWGILGTSIILIFCIKLIYYSVNFLNIFKNKIILIPGLSLFGVAIHGLVEGSFYHPITTFYSILFLSILVSELEKKFLH